MSDEPTPRRQLALRVIDWIMGIDTAWQLAIFITIGFALLAGTMLYQHPEWLENAWRYHHGLPLHEEAP